MIPDWIAEDYMDMELCELYGCTPSQLDEEDHHRIERHMVIRGAISAYQKQESKSR